MTSNLWLGGVSTFAPSPSTYSHHILAAKPAFEGIRPPVSDLTQLISDRHQPPSDPTSRQAFDGIRPLVDISLLHETDFSPKLFTFQTLLVLTKCRNLTTPENYQFKFPATNYAFNAAVLSSSLSVRQSAPCLCHTWTCCWCSRAYFRNITCCCSFYC